MSRYFRVMMLVIATALFGHVAFAHGSNNPGSNGGWHQNQNPNCNHQIYHGQSRQYTVTVQRDWNRGGYNNQPHNTFADRDYDNHDGYPGRQPNGGGWHDWRPGGGNQWHAWHPGNQPGYPDMSYQAWNQPRPGVTIYFTTQNDYHGYGW